MDESDREARLGDSVSLAVLVVLDSLPPDEQLAFVLHDVFAVPFDRIGHVLDWSPAVARQLVSRARRRIQGGSVARHTSVPGGVNEV